MQPFTTADHSDDSELLTRAEAARFLTDVLKHRTAPQTLAKFASIGGGPEFQLSGRWPVYTKGGCRRWVAARRTRTVHSTSELHSNTAA